MIWTTANSLAICQLIREARCKEEKDYAVAATSQYQQSILPRLARKRECKICAMKHPTGLHGYVLRWKVGGAAGNSKDVIVTL